jgi:4-amino-4-deoxy-L-arabinose transferase-like glycosyltransferase
MSNQLAFFQTTPRWYLAVLGILFVLYLSFWIASAQGLDHAYVHPGVLSSQGQLIIAVNGDSGEYVALATSLLHGHFALPGEAFEYFRTPGYPGVIAAVEFLGGSYATVTFLQILLTFCVALMVSALGARFFSARTGMLASILFLLNPLILDLSLQVMSDISFTFLFVLGITILLLQFNRHPLYSVLFSALIFAAASYVRPAGAVMLPLFIAPIIIASASWSRKFWSAILLVIVFMLALLPWMLRNYHDSGVLSFSSLAAYNFTAYNVPMFEAALHKDDPLAERFAMQTAIGIPLEQWRDLSVSASLERYDRTAILAHPVRYGAYHIFESTGFFVNSGFQPLLAYMSGPFHYTVAPSSQLNLKDLLIHGQIPLFIKTLTTPWWLFGERILLVLGMCLIVVALYVQRRSAFAWMAVFIILYFAELAGPIAEARYRIPCTPFIELLIASGLLALWPIVRTRFIKLCRS